MSLEQALQENTAAVKALAGLLANSLASSALPAAAPTVSQTAAEPAPKRTRSPKAANAAAPAEPAALANEKAEPTPAATRYFYSAKHDSAWLRQPDDPVMDVSGLGAVEITAEEFAAHEERFARRYAEMAKHGSQSANAAPAADMDSDDLFGEAPETYTYAQVVEKLKQLTRHPADQGGGMSAVRAVLACEAVKVANVPALEQSPDKFAAVMAACRKILEG